MIRQECGDDTIVEHLRRETCQHARIAIILTDHQSVVALGRPLLGRPLAGEPAFPDVAQLAPQLPQAILPVDYGHRAWVDVQQTINLPGSVLPDGETPLAKLIRKAEQDSLLVEATNASFEAKGTL